MPAGTPSNAAVPESVSAGAAGVAAGAHALSKKTATRIMPKIFFIFTLLIWLINGEIRLDVVFPYRSL
jgi:hypothetical protein